MGTENGGDWEKISVIKQISDAEGTFPTFDDCFVITNMTHY